MSMMREDGEQIGRFKGARLDAGIGIDLQAVGLACIQKSNSRAV